MQKLFGSRGVFVRFNQFSKSSGSGFIHGPSGDITPQAVYAQRRDWLKHMAAGAAGLSMAAWASREAMAQTPSDVVVRPGKLAPLTGAVSRVSGANTMEKITTYADASSYNNFYEFGTDKSDPAKYAHTLQIKPWTVEVEGLVKKPGRFRPRRLAQTQPHGRAHLPLALCGRLVNGYSVGGLLAGRTHQTCGAFGQRQVCGVHHPGRPQNYARRALACARLALRRRLAHGRGHAPTHAAELWHVRRSVAQPKRRACALGGALEIWLRITDCP